MPTLQCMLRKGMAATTVRDVAQEMGTSSGLIHHYYASMDELLAEAFERAAGQDLEATRAAMAAGVDPVDSLRIFFDTYVRADEDVGLPALAGCLGRGRPPSGRAGDVSTAERRLAGTARGRDRSGCRDGADDLSRPQRLRLADPVPARRTRAAGRRARQSTSSATR